MFEVIHSQEDAIRSLFEALEQRCLEEGIMGVEIDVSAHAPRMQRTLLELGYLPNAYVPAIAFDDVERVDVVKMYRLFRELEELPFEAPEPILSLGRYVLGQFAAVQVMPRLSRAMANLDICRGLTEEQSSRLLGEFRSRTFHAGDEIFAQGTPPREMIVIVDGRARVEVDGGQVGAVGPGESLGEVSFLNRTNRSASAIAETAMEVGILSEGNPEALVRRRPDIGTIVYRNLARGLDEKLRRADRAQRAIGSR